MNVNILGVGHSGTTYLYRLVQQLIREQWQGDLHSCYEAFLRDEKFLGPDYEEAATRTRYVESLSHAGIQAHLDMPLLIRNPAPYIDNPYLGNLYDYRPSSLLSRTRALAFGDRRKDVEHRLVRFTGACGRYALIERISEPSKSVFILRNPYAIARSLKRGFSFYGGEFHTDDAARLVDEVNTLYGRSISLSSFVNELDLQLFYWLTMNRFALENFEHACNAPCVMQMEEFESAPVQAFERMCSELGFQAQAHLHEKLQAWADSIRDAPRLTRDELKVTSRYLEAYEELLGNSGLAHFFDYSLFRRESDVVGATDLGKAPGYGLDGLALQKLLRKQNAGMEASASTAGAAPMFAHVVNPVIVGNDSDLKRAQPITFETMNAAAKLARVSGISIEQLAVAYEEDESLVPDFMKSCSRLTRSCLDTGVFEKQRKLPLFQDIFARALEASDAEYLIYTNVDIALMPHFYLTADALVRQGYDAITIYRRTLSDDYESVAEVPAMYADMGSDHPGTDCFIMRRSLVERLNLEKIVIGAQFCAFALRAHLYALTDNIVEFPRLHMTFHIGDDRAWAKQDEYSAYNLEQVDRMFDRLLENPPSQDRSSLDSFFEQYLSRKANWERHRKSPQPPS